MATKKAAKTKPSGKKNKTETSEPLSNFKTPATGRKDIDIPSKPKPNGVEINIEKFKLIKGEFPEITFSRIEKDATPTSVKESHKTPVHPDLLNSLKSLCIHLGLICDFLDTKDIKKIEKYDESLIDKFRVTGISIGGSDGEEGVVLTGQKINKKGMAVILNSPFTRFEESPDTAYKFVDDLREKVDVVIEEVKAYMNGSKVGEEKQGKLDFGVDQEEYQHEEDK